MKVDARVTINNVEVCIRPMPRQDASRPIVTWGGFWEPGIGLNLHPDYAWAYAPTPIGPARTELRQYWMVARDAEEGVDYDVEKLTEIWDITMRQDRNLCENVQRGIEMPAYRPGPLNRVHQGGIAGFYAWYRQQIRQHFPDVVEVRAD
jgi:phenylpropionate dioxygenase-like ring-hydroxylating dioxygenase large terminal subunit